MNQLLLLCNPQKEYQHKFQKILLKGKLQQDKFNRLDNHIHLQHKEVQFCSLQ